MACTSSATPVFNHNNNNDYRHTVKEEVLENKFGPHVLPPCRVCGAQATGYHYGANTCEACKGFFHRSLNKKDSYVCLKNAKCVLKPGNRSLCPFCRYQRCTEIGMSKSGIKTGRYSYAKRTQDILELKGMTKRENTTPSPSQPPPLTKKRRLDYSTERMKVITHTFTKLKEAGDRFFLSQVENTNRMQVNLLKSKLGIPIDPSVIEAIKTPLTTGLSFMSFMPKLSSNDLLGGVNGSPVKETDAVKKWIEVLGGSTGPITMMVSFIKSIPGFTQLAMTDQIQLLKHSIIEIWLIARHNMFDAKTKRFKTVSGFSLDLSNTLGEDLTDAMLASAVKLQRLKLDSDIVCVLVAFVAVAADRCSLHRPDETAKIQDGILDLLLYILHEKYKEQYLLHFARIIAAITELRDVTEVYLKMANVYIATLQDVPPLLAEILTLANPS